MTIPSGHCRRARAWVSLRVDGELSELERALLQAHLARCPDCAEFADGIDGLEALVRSAPLEPLSHPVAVRPLPAGRSLRLLQLGAAVAVAATAGLAAVTVGAFQTAGQVTTAPKLERVSVLGDETPSTMRELRRIYLVGEARRLLDRHVLQP